MTEGPYRTPAGPPARKSSPGGALGGTLVVVALLHVAFGLAFLLLTPVLRWIGPNNLLGMGIRILVSLAGLGIVGFALLLTLGIWGGMRGIIAGIALAVGWLVLFIVLADHEPKLYLLFLRTGDVDLEPLGWWEMILSGSANLAVDGMIAAILVMKPLHSQAELEKSRLIVANLSPCERCRGSWELVGDLKRCRGCGHEAAAPTMKEIKEIRGTPDA